MPKSFRDIKRKALQKRLDELTQEYEAANNQLGTLLSASDRLRLQRQIDDLARQIQEVIGQLHPLLDALKAEWDQADGHRLSSDGEVLRPQGVQSDRHRDWGDMPDNPIFFGRNEELATLEKWIIEDRCRLVAILGLRGIGKTKLSVKLGKGGIGKTDLSLKLAQGIQDDFDYVIWRRLLNTPKLKGLLVDLIKFLSNQQEIDLPDTVDGQIARLLVYLQQHRCLLILDNVEAILQSGDRTAKYLDGYEEYGQLFSQVGTVPHQSCLLITSREKPKEIAQIEGKTYPVRSLELGGLSQLDAKNIFSAIGSFVGSDKEWSELNKFYNGNPLALELAAKHISEVFSGDISEFLKEGKPIFNDLRDLLNWHFERLSGLQVEVMYWLAINREPVSLLELKEDILSLSSKEQVPSTMQALQRRIPLEKSGFRFTLQPMLIEYVTELLIERISEEITTGQISLFNSYALLKASAKDYVRESQRRLILKPIYQKLIAMLGSQSGVEARVMQILSTFQKEPTPKLGYVGGNVLNLLCLLKNHLTGYNFSNLAIWQAYLQDVELHDVNFSFCSFANFAFRDTFGITLSVIFSPNQEFIAAGTGNGEVRLWRFNDGTPHLTYHGHTDWVRSIAFSPDGSLLASGSYDQTVRLWEVSTGYCIHNLYGHDSEIHSVAFSPDGKTVASGGGDFTIRVWDVNTGHCLQILQEHTGTVASVAFSPDGKTLASGSHDQTVRLWEVSTGKCLKVLQGHHKSVHSVAFSPDGKAIISGSRDQTVCLWDAGTSLLLSSFQGHTNGVWSVAFSPNGEIVASGSYDQTIRLWETRTGYCFSTMQGHNGWIWSVAFSPDGKTLASGSHDQTVRLWEVSTGHLLRSLEGYSNGVYAVAVSSNGKTIASTNERETVCLWDASTGRRLNVLQGHKNRVGSVAYGPDGILLVSGSTDQTIRIWDTSTGRCLQTMEGHTNPIWSVAYSPDGKTVASGSGDHTVRIWDVNTGHCLQILQGHTSGIWSVAYSPDGKTVASGGRDQTIRLWEVSTGKCLKVMVGHSRGIYSNRIHAVAFSSDGSLLATGSGDHIICLWATGTGEHLRCMEGHSNAVFSVAFSPGGNTVASGSGDQTVKIWDVGTGQPLRSLTGHSKSVWSVAYSPDGKTVISSSDDETIKLWDVQNGVCLNTLKNTKPYERMNITNALGMTESQKVALKTLGAIEESTR